MDAVGGAVCLALALVELGTFDNSKLGRIRHAHRLHCVRRGAGAGYLLCYGAANSAEQERHIDKLPRALDGFCHVL